MADIVDKSAIKLQIKSQSNNPKQKDQICYGDDLRDYQITNQIELKWLIESYNLINDKQSFFFDDFKKLVGNEILENNFQIFEAWKSFEIGDLKITPYLVDHSATDAYAFLIEADGKKVLYSGDFRANGRKSKLFDKMIKDKNLQNVDILLMEGTMLQRSNKDFPDEQSVEDKILETIKENNQISFMIGSSQNIDSLVSAYRASKKAKKIFVVDNCHGSSFYPFMRTIVL